MAWFQLFRKRDNRKSIWEKIPWELTVSESEANSQKGLHYELLEVKNQSLTFTHAHYIISDKVSY